MDINENNLDPQAEENLNDIIDDLDAVGGETPKNANDFIIHDPEQFIKDYNNYLTYKNIDNFTLLALIESYFFAKSNELILNKSEFITFDLFKSLMNLASSATIKTIRIQNLQLKGRALKYLSKCRYISLKELELDSCPYIESPAVASFFNSSEKTLKEFNKIIFKKVFIEDPCITSIVNSFYKMPELKELIFVDCPNLTSLAFQNLFPLKTSSIRMLHLEKLNMSDKVLSKFSVSESLSTLENLTLIKLSGLNDQGLVDLFSSPFLNSLKKLEIRNLVSIKGLFLNELQNKATDLISLKLGELPNLTQDNLENFLKQTAPFLSNLKVLEMSQLSQLSNTFATELSYLHFQELEELTMNYYLKMNSSSLVQLLSSDITNTIKTLNLENCTGLVDFPSNMSSLSKCNLKNLQKLNLNYCAKLSSYIIQAIGTIASLSNLKILSLNGVQTLDDVTCLYLTKSNYFQSITELYLENCPSITIKSFQELMRSVMTQNMEVLSLEGNSQLNDEIWGYFNRSPNLTKLRDLRLRGLNITSAGVDKLIESDKMLNIEILYLTDACFAFPSFYMSAKCSKLNKIEGSFDNITPEEVENLLQSPYLSPGFEFQDIINKVIMDDGIMTALTNGKSNFLKKIWDFPQCDIRDMNTDSIEQMLKSEKLNPFFNLDRFLKEMKAIVKDSMLEAMSKNPLCVNNLFDLDLVGCKNVTSIGVEAILLSKYLCPFFNISGFLKSMKYTFATQASVILPLITHANFTKMIKKLDLDDYELDGGLLRKELLLKPNVFPNLRTLNLSRTKIDDRDLLALAENEVMVILIVLNLNNNPSITREGFHKFFEITSKKDLMLRKLDLEYCKINNSHLKAITEAPFAKHLKSVSLGGCKEVDGMGLAYFMELYNKYKKIDMKDIYEKFKHYINYDDKKKVYSLRKEVDADSSEIYQFLKNINDGVKIKKVEIERNRNMIRDKVMISLCKEKRMENIHKLNLTNCNITSKLLFEIAVSKHLKQIQDLNLENTNIDDQGVKSLCYSRNMSNLRKLKLDYCNYITKVAITAILMGNFHNDFNPDQILTHFADTIDPELLQTMVDNKFFYNFQKLDLTKKTDFNLEELDTLIKMQKKNPILDINVSLKQIFDKYKSEVSDQILIDLAEAKLLSTTRHLDLAGAPLSEEGLMAIFTSKYANPNLFLFSI